MCACVYVVILVIMRVMSCLCHQAIPAGEVDEEGYSIRPQDAAAIRGFPDDNPTQDSDDSDFEDGEYGYTIVCLRTTLQ